MRFIPLKTTWLNAYKEHQHNEGHLEYTVSSSLMSTNNLCITYKNNNAIQKMIMVFRNCFRPESSGHVREFNISTFLKNTL